VGENAEETTKAGIEAARAATSMSCGERLIPSRLRSGLKMKTGVAMSHVTKNASKRLLELTSPGSGSSTRDKMIPAIAGPKRASIRTGATSLIPLA
jgi:hypothetical protein